MHVVNVFAVLVLVFLFNQVLFVKLSQSLVEIGENLVEFAFDSQVFAVAFSFDQFSESGFLGQASSFSVDDFCGKSGIFRSDGALFRGKSVPAAGLGRFHPVSNFEEVSEIVSNQAALLFGP